MHTRCHPLRITKAHGNYALIIVDEVSDIPFEQDANLFFQLVSSRYEHASLILTSNLPFSGWSSVFGDQTVAAARIDRVIHHADVLTLKGARHRLRIRGIDALPSVRTQDTADLNNKEPVASLSSGSSASLSSVVDSFAR